MKVPATIAEPPAGIPEPSPTASDGSLEAFYRELPPLFTKPLWCVLTEALTPEPRVRSAPHVWRYRDLRPRLLRAGELVTAEEAERRVLMLLNPATGDRPAVTETLYAGLQLILPGEVARTHHHTPSAIRFIVEGEGGYTVVSGEKSMMHKGDFLTTPNWTWHDHGSEGDQPVIWLDGLDIPFVTNLDAIFFQEFADVSDGEQVQPVTKSLEDSQWRWGSNLRPTWQGPSATYTPVLNYRWDRCRAALHALRDDTGSPFDGIILEYINPHTGGPALPTMSAYLQLLPAGEHTRAHRHVASTVYHVAEGGGYSIIAGERFDWEAGDTFVVPAWAWHEHASASGEAVLFSFSDRPVLQAFGLEREQPHPAGHQE
jgi:gentisate 1,2-dioxygenase